MNFQMFKLDLGKAEEPEIKLPTSVGSQEKQESSRKTSTSALLTTPKPLSVDHNKLENHERDGNTRPPTCLRNLFAGQEATVRTGHETNRLAQNWARSTSRLYTLTLFIELLGRVHHAKCWAG